MAGQQPPDTEIIELWAGPMDGKIFETEPGWRMPDAIGIKDHDDRSITHWYVTNRDKSRAKYIGTQEPIPGHDYEC